MPAELGGSKRLRVKDSSATAATFFAVAGERSFQVNYDAPSVALDAKGDTSIENAATRVNVTCSVDALYVLGDSAQSQLLSAMRNNVQVTLEIYHDGSAEQSGLATITSLQIVHADKEAAVFSAEFDMDGDFA